jgi:hypothetical protein
MLPGSRVCISAHLGPAHLCTSRVWDSACTCGSRGDLSSCSDKPSYHPLQEQGGKAAQEAAVEAALTEHGIDVIVLARYMQVLLE